MHGVFYNTTAIKSFDAIVRHTAEAQCSVLRIYPTMSSMEEV